MADTSRLIERIPESRLAEAARLVAGRKDEPDAGVRLLAAARATGITLDEFWALAVGPDKPYSAAALLVGSSGATRMVYTSPVVSREDADAVATLLGHACDRVTSGKIAQALLGPDESMARRAYEAAGFCTVGDLLYMRRPWSDPGCVDHVWPPGVEVIPWREDRVEDLAVALERSYEGTLDCPELCGMRETADVIDSHKATGVFNPSLWWVVLQNGAPAGALLLNPVPEQDHTELVYLGLAPTLRGRGLASRLLRFGLSRLRRCKHRTTLCAVDARNTPARRLYETAGFEEFARRTALVRTLPLAAPRASCASPSSGDSLL